MPTNLFAKDPRNVSYDADCEPLNSAVIEEFLASDRSDHLRVSRSAAAIPKIRVELHKNVLSTMPSTIEAAGGVVFPFSHRNLSQDDKGYINLTPYVSSATAGKSIYGATGYASISLKGSVLQSLTPDPPRSDHTFQADPTHIDWLTVLEDGDLITIHMDTGVADVSSSQADGIEGFSFHEQESERTGVAHAYEIPRPPGGTVGSITPLVFFGFVESVSKTRRSNDLGASIVTYSVECADFSKAFQSFVQLLSLQKSPTEILGEWVKRQGAFNSGLVSPDIFAMVMAPALLRRRELDEEAYESIKEKVSDILEEDKNRPEATTDAPVEDNSTVAHEKQLDEAEAFDALLANLAYIGQAKAKGLKGAKFAPRSFLLPVSLTSRGAPFSYEGLPDNDAKAFHHLGGVQLAELLQFSSGEGRLNNGYTPAGSIIPAFDAGGDGKNNRKVEARIGGRYGGSPVGVGLLTGSLSDLTAEIQVEFQKIDNLLQSNVMGAMGLVELFYDLAAYDVGEGNAPVFLPTVFCRNTPSPQQILSEFENKSIMTALESGESRIADDFIAALAGWQNLPTSFCSETDLIAETLIRGGRQRTNFTGMAVGLPSGSSEAATGVRAAQSLKEASLDGFNVDVPVAHLRQSLLAHGFLPNFVTASGITDPSFVEDDKFSPKGSVGFSTTLCRKWRDQTLLDPIYVRGTVTTALLMPSIRVGQRLCIYRGGRSIPDFSDFEVKHYLANTFQDSTINRVYADNIDMIPDENTAVITDEDITRIQRKIKESGYDGADVEAQINFDPSNAARRAYFFAHFDTFYVEEVTHNISISPGTGEIEGTTQAVLSKGAIGKEYAKILDPMIEAGPRDSATVSDARMLARLKEAMEGIKADAAAIGKKTNDWGGREAGQVNFDASDETHRELDRIDRYREHAASLIEKAKVAGLQIEAKATYSTYREIINDGASAQDIARYPSLVAALDKHKVFFEYQIDVASSALFFRKTDALTAIVDRIKESEKKRIPFPSKLLLPFIIAGLTEALIADPLAEWETTSLILHGNPAQDHDVPVSEIDREELAAKIDGIVEAAFTHFKQDATEILTLQQRASAAFPSGGG